MDVYVYGDESGTFDAAHYDYYILGGIIIPDREPKDAAIRRYIAAEHAIRKMANVEGEVKATVLSPKAKMSLFRSTNGLVRFACVIDLKRVHPGIMGNKKSAQRFLDFAFKIAVKRCLLHLVDNGEIEEGSISDILISFDEHKTATNGRYELQESIAAEFKDGVVAYDGHFVEPAFPEMGNVKTRFVDSSTDALIRASDIIANVVLHKAIEGRLDEIPKDRVFLVQLP